MIIKIKDAGDVCSAELVISGLLSAFEDFKTLDIELGDNESIDEESVKKIREVKSLLGKIREGRMYPAYVVI